MTETSMKIQAVWKPYGGSVAYYALSLFASSCTNICIFPSHLKGACRSVWQKEHLIAQNVLCSDNTQVIWINICAHLYKIETGWVILPQREDFDANMHVNVPLLCQLGMGCNWSTPIHLKSYYKDTDLTGNNQGRFALSNTTAEVTAHY